jgi:hypothetical protein
VGARPSRRRDENVFLGPTSALTGVGREGGVVAPVFPLSGLQQLVRGRNGDGPATADALARRFAASMAVCGPGDTEGHTRTHLKPTGFVDGFDPGGAPRLSVRLRDGLRDRTRWLCSYAVARLAEAVAGEREAGARPPEQRGVA